MPLPSKSHLKAAVLRKYCFLIATINHLAPLLLQYFQERSHFLTSLLPVSLPNKHQNVATTSLHHLSGISLLTKQRANGKRNRPLISLFSTTPHCWQQNCAHTYKVARAGSSSNLLLSLHLAVPPKRPHTALLLPTRSQRKQRKTTSNKSAHLHFDTLFSEKKQREMLTLWVQ